jgi:TolA-binding protein
MTPTVYMVLFVSLSVAIAFGAWVMARHLGAARHAKAALAAGAEYRQLADEFRRLSDMGLTAQEHTELRLTELSVQMNDLRDKLEQMQRILNEVE